MRIVTEEQENRNQEWLATMPKTIREVGKKIKPGHLYMYPETGQFVLPYSFDEADAEVLLTILVLKKYNGPCLECKVFGISPNDLRELTKSEYEAQKEHEK